MSTQDAHRPPPPAQGFPTSTAPTSGMGPSLWGAILGMSEFQHPRPPAPCQEHAPFPRPLTTQTAPKHQQMSQRAGGSLTEKRGAHVRQTRPTTGSWREKPSGRPQVGSSAENIPSYGGSPGGRVGCHAARPAPPPRRPQETPGHEGHRGEQEATLISGSSSRFPIFISLFPSLSLPFQIICE